MATPPPPLPKKRRPVRKLFKWIGVIALVLVIAGWWSISRIPHIEPGTTLASGWYNQNFLLVGSDSRADLPDDLEGSFGSFGGERADVVILARAHGGRLHLLSLPRDLKVEIPGVGVDKLNAAFAFGGGGLLAETVEDATQVPVHHVVEIDFAGLAELVDAMGGVDLDFPNSARDTKSGLFVEAGTTRVDGATALAYARSRSYQELQNDQWVSIDADDIGRTARQREVLDALLRRVRSLDGFGRTPGLLWELGDSIRVDENLAIGDVLLTVPRLWRAEVWGATVPVNFSNEGGVSYLVFDSGEADEAVRRFLAGEFPLEPE